MVLNKVILDVHRHYHHHQLKDTINHCRPCCHHLPHSGAHYKALGGF